MTDTLVKAILSSEISFLHSLLFSPPLPVTASHSLYPMSSPLLVNRQDSKGWSPIHYCTVVPHPSIEILDTLYCAGADVALFTTVEHYTPLHCLARYAHPSDDPGLLYEFATHLILDLRAPLSAVDMQDETCIHIAAEHGNSIDILQVLLHCDITGSVRELRNARG